MMEESRISHLIDELLRQFNEYSKTLVPAENQKIGLAAANFQQNPVKF